MIQGTGSGAGKSLIVTALCRILSDMGLNVAPFKAQNMALNSFITASGGEIGRAQALQAEAARQEPCVDMNPILLKAQGDSVSQVIMRGKVYKCMRAQEYYKFRNQAWETATASFDALSEMHEVIVIEGAGSPAEINLMDVDIVNMSVAKYACAPVILVGDIDKGGVFASLYGTVKLLGDEARHIKGFLINKFRGDIGILQPGLDMIQEKTGIPVLGVLPWFDRTGLPEEDGLALSQEGGVRRGRFETCPYSEVQGIKVVVVRLQYISNFTDFDPFLHEPDVELVYSTNPAEIENADMVIVPGTKNTVKDLLYLRERGLDQSIARACAKGVQVVGMCGGYQMLGRRISDPLRIESDHQEVKGLGLLDIETTFEAGKVTSRVNAAMLHPIHPYADTLINGLHGYEIHMGTSSGDIGLFRLRRFPDCRDEVLDGSMNRNCWGTYLHGIFENDFFRRAVINGLRMKKGLPSFESGVQYAGIKDKAIDIVAQAVKKNINMDFIKRLLGL